MDETKQLIDTLKDHKDPAVRKTGEKLEAIFDRRRRILCLVQEALGQLRVDMKYLMFDLECTRRERDEARGLV